jgi:ParB-like chromosome segregation protein Spo0J
MPEKVKLSFKFGIRSLPIGFIFPRRQIEDNVRKSVKYCRIRASISAVGIIEPIIVAPLKGQKDAFMLLDGHIRFEIIQELGRSSIDCIISSDDEGHTYNKRVSHLATIQEHYMIVRALRGGVPREKLAAALNVDIKRIEQRRTMLDGVSPEVIELLKERPGMNAGVFKVIRKMKPARQIAVVTLMLTVNNLTKTYAQALLAGTKPSDLKNGPKSKKMYGLTVEQMARMERESESLQVDFKEVEARHGDDVLNLMIACGYISKLLRNQAVERYMSKREAGIVEQLRAVISATSPDRDWSKA